MVLCMYAISCVHGILPRLTLMSASANKAARLRALAAYCQLRGLWQPAEAEGSSTPLYDACTLSLSQAAKRGQRQPVTLLNSRARCVSCYKSSN